MTLKHAVKLLRRAIREIAQMQTTISSKANSSSWKKQMLKMSVKIGVLAAKLLDHFLNNTQFCSHFHLHELGNK